MRIWIIVGRNVSVDFVYDLFYWLIDVFLYLPNFFFFLYVRKFLKHNQKTSKNGKINQKQNIKKCANILPINY